MELYLHCPYIYSWWAQGQNPFCISFLCGDQFMHSKAFILQNEEHSGSGKLKTRNVLSNFLSLIWLSESALILGLSVDWHSNLQSVSSAFFLLCRNYNLKFFLECCRWILYVIKHKLCLKQQVLTHMMMDLDLLVLGFVRNGLLFIN